MLNVGDYYKGVLSGKTNPIISACQKCFTIMFTDGYWNGSFSSSTISDADKDGISNTLADVARYYYVTDLSSYANNVVPDTYTLKKSAASGVTQFLVQLRLAN